MNLIQKNSSLLRSYLVNKHSIIFIFFLFITSISLGQSTVNLDGNNINATIINNGRFFNNEGITAPGYEFPKGSGNHLIFSNTISFGGIDEEDELRMAATIFGAGNDLFRGVISNDSSLASPEITYYGDIYEVSRVEIENHVANVFSTDYTIPHGILEWPAHGDTTLGYDYALAPFADLNGNKIYEPELGEFPKIRGDHAIYFIMNDRLGVHTETNTKPLGIEIHYMFYQYNSSDEDINNTTFLHTRIINRSDRNYPEFIVSNVIDPDIGRRDDDRIGCNIENDVMFAYNGTSFDEGQSGSSGYRENPPAVGVVSLNNPMHTFGFSGGVPPTFPIPPFSATIWNWMNAKWPDGEPYQFDGDGMSSGIPTNHLYSGEIISETDTTTWNEIAVGLVPGDRRVQMSSASVSFNVGEVLCHDYAIIVSHDAGDNIGNAKAIPDLAAKVKDFYSDQPNTHCDFVLSTEEESGTSENTPLFSVYPNPAHDQFTIQANGQFDMQLLSIDGRVILAEANQFDQVVVEEKLARGTYLLVITQNSERSTAKMIIK